MNIMNTVRLDLTMTNTPGKSDCIEIAEWISRDLKSRFDKKRFIEMDIRCDVRACNCLLVKETGEKALRIVFREDT